MLLLDETDLCILTPDAPNILTKRRSVHSGNGGTMVQEGKCHSEHHQNYCSQSCLTLIARKRDNKTNSTSINI